MSDVSGSLRVRQAVVRVLRVLDPPSQMSADQTLDTRSAHDAFVRIGKSARRRGSRSSRPPQMNAAT